MRILFDQNVPRALRNLLPGHDVRTALEMGWSTLSNGILVEAAERAGFDAIITADRNIRNQLDISSSNLAVVILSTNHWRTLQRGGSAIRQALQRGAVGIGRGNGSGPVPPWPLRSCADRVKHGLAIWWTAAAREMKQRRCERESCRDR